METYPTSPVIQYVFTEKIDFKTLVSAFENGYEQRRRKWAHGKRSFSLKYNVLTYNETDTLYDFYIARNGTYDAFSFVNPNDNQTYTVRFTDDQMSFDHFSQAICSTGLNMVEVF